MSEFGFYYQIVCCVKCGEECGNGFLIDGHTIVTASHILAPYRCDKSFSISVQFEDADSHIICEVLSDGSDGNPVSLLSLPCDRDTFCRKLNDAELKEDELAAAYGFAGTIQSKVDRLSLKCVRVFGKVVKPADNGNVSFNPIEEHRPNFKGFSGSPIVYKGGIIGMLLAQSSNNGVADRLYGICGLAFREFLSSLGVSLPVDKTPIDLRQSNQSALSTPPVAQTTISEIDILLSKLFEPVRNAHESGQALKSRKSLVKFFDTLESINCTDKKKAEFFYLGALWMRIDGTNDAAEKYYVKAKEYFPGLNDKVYRAYELLQGGRISEAQRLLLPVSDTVELNALLACLIEDKSALPEILTEIGKVDIQKDCYTHRLLAIAALQSEAYSAGLEYIHKAAPAGTINPDNAVIGSLLHFWSAMGETYPDTNRLGFVFASNRRFYPTIGQQEELEAAYDILSAANDSGAEGISEFQRQTILWGLVAISDLIPGKDSQYWLNRFKDAAPNHPFTILYSISKGISLAEKDKNDFLNRPTQGQSGIYAYAKLQLLLSLKKYDEAKAYFEEHKESIAHYKSSSVAEEELEVLFACHDYSAAKEILGQVDMQSEVKERYALGIQFNLSGKARKELIRNATEFAEKTGQPIDYYNAGVMCSKFSKWKDAIANARRWWAKTREQIALEFLAEAYYNKGDHKKCLKIIDKVKCNGTLWEGIIKFEINSLAAMAKYNEARVQSQALGYTVTDPRYSVWLARTYIAEGNSKMAIRALRDCADSGQCDIEVYELLIQQLQGEEPDLAYHYAKQLHFNFPNNPKVTNFVGRVALMTGHESEDISSAFFRQLQDEAKTNSGTRLVTLDEAVKIIKETNEWQREIEAKYKKIEIPIHALITSGNQCLGALACSIYDDKNLPYYGRYGMAKEISISKKTPLVIDYTACLTLCRFGVFQKVCDYFGHVWLDSHIFELWLEEINRLTNVQHNVVNQEIALSEHLKKLKFNTYSNDKPIPGDLPYCPSDYYTIEHAKATGALLVGCKAAGKFHGKDIPADWKDYFIEPKDFYAALERLGLRHPPFDAKSVNVELSARILPGCNLILDQMVMVELLNNNALEAAFEYFKIWISENEAESINIRAKAYCEQKALAEWLKEALSTVRACYDKGSATLQTFSTEKLRGTIEPPLQLLVEELDAASRRPFCLVFDDRWCSSYYKIKTKDSSSYIFTTYDIICFLHSEKALSDSEFYDLIDRLICDKYCFFVPPAEYLMSRLNLTSVSDVGSLNETDILGALRRLISFSIESEEGLSDVAANASLLPEVGGFLTELHQELKKCLCLVWGSDRETEWKEAVSEWLLTYLGDFICDTDKLCVDGKHGLSIELSFLFLNSFFQKPLDPNREFVQWISSKAVIPWAMNEDILHKSAQSICEVLSTLNEPVDNEGPKSEFYNKFTRQFLFYIISMAPPIMRRELLEKQMFSEYKENLGCSGTNGLGIYRQTSFMGGDCCLDINGVLSGNDEALENAIMFVCAAPDSNIDLLLAGFTEERLNTVPVSTLPVLCKFLLDLSWYVPADRRKTITKFKRKLAMLF